MIVTTEGEKNVKEIVSAKFDNLLIAFDRVAHLVRLVGVLKSSIDKNKQNLLNWKEKAIHKIPTFPKAAPKEIAEILLAHLHPKTPDLTIAETFLSGYPRARDNWLLTFILSGKGPGGSKSSFTVQVRNRFLQL